MFPLRRKEHFFISRKIRDIFTDPKPNDPGWGTDPISNGNYFNFVKNVEVANEKTLNIKLYEDPNEEVSSEIINIVDSVINDKQLNIWWLLLQQANYFVNTIKFTCTSPLLYEKLKQVILIAFLEGKGGLFWDDKLKIWKVCRVVNLEFNKDQILSSAKVDFNNIEFANNYITKDTENLTELSASELTNLFIFKWNQQMLGAYVLMLPFCRLQQMWLNQITILSILQSKQFYVKQTLKSEDKSWVKNFLNPKLIWLIIRKGLGLSDKVEIIDNTALLQNISVAIDNYKKLVDIYNDIFGVKNNTDFKKERNVSDEIEASQDQFNALQNEYITNFCIFAERIKNSVRLGGEKVGITIYYDY